MLRDAGAELAVTYVNVKAVPYVRPLAEQLDSPIIVPCDVREPGQLEAVFSQIQDKWGRLDFLLHSIAYAPKEDLQKTRSDTPPECLITYVQIDKTFLTVRLMFCRERH